MITANELDRIRKVIENAIDLHVSMCSFVLARGESDTVNQPRSEVYVRYSMRLGQLAVTEYAADGRVADDRRFKNMSEALEYYRPGAEKQ